MKKRAVCIYDFVSICISIKMDKSEYILAGTKISTQIIVYSQINSHGHIDLNFYRSEN